MIGCQGDGCKDITYDETLVIPPLPEDECCGGSGGGGGEGHKYTFASTATGWQVREDGKVIYNYTDKNDNTTYTWQATTEGWLVKDNAGNVIFTYTDKSGENTTYNFEQTDDCGIKVTDNTGKVVFEYENNCAGTTYTFEQVGADFKVTNDKTGQVVFTYKGTKDTNTTYNFEDYKDGFKVTDSDGVVAYIYDPTLGDRSDGSYPIDTLLTTVFKGHTTISTGQIIGFTPADLVVGETLVYDGVGTVGVITRDNGDGTYQVTTMTTSPGSRQGVRLGSVDTEADLPATCAAAEALGWQTPQLGDFAYVIEKDGTAEDVISEYVITNVDENCNLTWTFSHSFNAGQYQEQSTTSMSGMILTGGVIPGTFGDPIDPSTLIRGVMRNGILLTPDAQGKVNVIVDDSHIIVNELPTTGIVDLAEYVVVDPTTLKVKSTWVHDATGWYETYAAITQVKAHQIVSELPTTGIEENVEYVVVDDDDNVLGTWVYAPTKGWLQTEKPERAAHIVVDELPTTGIDDTAEYVVVEDLDDPVNTYEASYVHTDKGWIKIAENANAGKSHIAVTALPTTNINEDAEYLVMTNTSDPSTLTGTWVRVNGNWVQTEKMEEGFHIVTSLPTSNIDDKNEYIVVEDLTKPDDTLIGHYAYDKATNKWISLSSKYEIYRGVSLNGYALSADDFQDVPVGAQISWMSDKIPAHYLLCDGTIYNVGDYPELEAWIIESKGSLNYYGGNGTTTWAVPDLRGEFLRGAGTNSRTMTVLGKTSSTGNGANVGVHQNPTAMGNSFPANNQGFYAYKIAEGSNQSTVNPDTTFPGTRQTSFTGSVSNTPANAVAMTTSRPTNTSTNWIIKCESTYAIVPNSDYKVTSKINFNTVINSNNSYRLGTITSSEDDTSMVSGNGIVAPVDGYYNISLRVAFTGAPATQFYVGAFVFKNYTPVNTTFNTWKDNSVAWSTDTTASTAWSGALCVASTTVKLAKGDKLTFAAGGVQATAPTGEISVTLATPMSRTEVSRAEVMMKPNIWPVGVEQDFGDGVYGVRLQFTNAQILAAQVSSQPSMVATYQITTNFNANQIINCGGTWTRGTSAWKIGIPGLLNESLASDFGVNGGKIGLSLINNSTAMTGNMSVDAWVLYTK